MGDRWEDFLIAVPIGVAWIIIGCAAWTLAKALKELFR